jgi:hypothetical protein
MGYPASDSLLDTLAVLDNMAMLDTLAMLRGGKVSNGGKVSKMAKASKGATYSHFYGVSHDRTTMRPLWHSPAGERDCRAVVPGRRATSAVLEVRAPAASLAHPGAGHRCAELCTMGPGPGKAAR